MKTSLKIIGIIIITSLCLYCSPKNEILCESHNIILLESKADEVDQARDAFIKSL